MGPEASRQTTGQMGSCAAMRVSSARAAPPASARGHTAHSAKTRTHASTRSRPRLRRRALALRVGRRRQAAAVVRSGRRRRHGDGAVVRSRRVLRRGRPPPAGRGRHAREPRGDARDRRLVEVRRRQRELLRVPRSTVLRAGAPQGRLHDRQRREQPRARLRRDGAGGDARGRQVCGLAPHRPTGRDRLSRARAACGSR